MNDEHDEEGAKGTWRPLPARERRVFGVLIEKAKTTPDVYPMTINALVSGCNQKSNRYPLMDLDADDVEESLEKLRESGAVVEVQSSSRVPRHKHLAYDWLGVDKTELAVMGELLLRGAQTLGDLRGRASRMEPIADLSALKPVVDGLIQKGLIVALSPPGRGQVVTHGLHEQRELEKLRAEHAHGAVTSGDDSDDDEASTPAALSGGVKIARGKDAEIVLLREEMDALRAEIGELRDAVEKLKSMVSA